MKRTPIVALLLVATGAAVLFELAQLRLDESGERSENAAPDAAAQRAGPSTVVGAEIEAESDQARLKTSASQESPVERVAPNAPKDIAVDNSSRAVARLEARYLELDRQVRTAAVRDALVESAAFESILADIAIGALGNPEARAQHERFLDAYEAFAEQAGIDFDILGRNECLSDLCVFELHELQGEQLAARFTNYLDQSPGFSSASVIAAEFRTPEGLVERRYFLASNSGGIILPGTGTYTLGQFPPIDD